MGRDEFGLEADRTLIGVERLHAPAELVQPRPQRQVCIGELGLECQGPTQQRHRLLQTSEFSECDPEVLHVEGGLGLERVPAR